MSHDVLVAAATGAVCVVALSPYLARLTLTAPDRQDPRWWVGAPAGRNRLLASALLALVLGALAGRAAGSSALLPAWVVLAALATPLSIIDFEHHRLPDRLVFPAAVLGVALLALAAAVRHDWPPLLRCIEAAAAVAGLFFMIALVAPFGLGDVKLGGVLAGYLGFLSWGHVLYGVLAGFVLASLASLPLVLARKATMKSPIPLGPALIVGALLVAGFDLVPGYLT